MTADVVIRAAGIADAKAIEAVRTASWRAAYCGFLDPKTLAGLDDFGWAGRWSASFDPAGGQFALLAEARGTAVGFAIAGPTREGWADFPGELYALYLHPEHQGHGLGRRLMEAAWDGLSARTLTPMHLMVMAENARGVDFYVRAGGIALGRDAPFKIDGVSLTDHAMGWVRRPFSAD